MMHGTQCTTKDDGWKLPEWLVLHYKGISVAEAAVR